MSSNVPCIRSTHHFINGGNLLQHLTKRAVYRCSICYRIPDQIKEFVFVEERRFGTFGQLSCGSLWKMRLLGSAFTTENHTEEVIYTLQHLSYSFGQTSVALDVC